MANFSDASLDALRSQHEALLAEVGKVIVGQDQVIREVTTAIFAGGRCGRCVRSTPAQALGLSFNASSSPVMPSDIVGSEILDESRQFKFVKGPLFSNIVLADEINRTPPKKRRRPFPKPCMPSRPQAIPTPAPFVSDPKPHVSRKDLLPEAQLDRFMFNTHHLLLRSTW